MKKHCFTLVILTLLACSLFAKGAAETLKAEDSNELTIYCYDTFASEWGSGPTLIPLFEEETGIKVNVVSTGDALEMLNKAIMEGENCPADLILGISDDSASRAYKSNLFATYKSPALLDIDDELEFDNEYRLLPFDYGAFAFVYDTESGIEPPTSLEDLKKDIYKDKVILIDPRTSSVGLGLLLWTIEVYGDNYLDWWKTVGANALTIADGWSSAYGLFTEGEAPIVLSYTTSPVYHVLWEDTTRYQALVFDEGHSTTIEGVGILKNAKNRANAEKFVDFILTEGQKETAIANSMYPVNKNTELPSAYDYAPIPKLLHIDSEVIAQNLEKWLNEWTEAMVK